MYWYTRKNYLSINVGTQSMFNHWKGSKSNKTKKAVDGNVLRRALCLSEGRSLKLNENSIDCIRF